MPKGFSKYSHLSWLGERLASAGRLAKARKKEVSFIYIVEVYCFGRPF
jgi:hypothetical protein